MSLFVFKILCSQQVQVFGELKTAERIVVINGLKRYVGGYLFIDFHDNI
jgi:hypothetical protein